MCRIIIFVLMSLMCGAGMAQNAKLSMGQLKKFTKEWKQPKDVLAEWSIIAANDETITVYKIENYKRKLRCFDYEFNIIAEYEYKNFDYDVHAQENGIDILCLEGKNSLTHWLLDARTLRPVKSEILDVSDDYYNKKVDVSRSDDDEYIKVKVGARVHYYDNNFSRVTGDAEKECMKKNFPDNQYSAPNYMDDKSKVEFVQKMSLSKALCFKWYEKAADGRWTLVRECDFGNKEEDYSGGKFLKVNSRKRDMMTVFVYNDRCCWLEFETLWNGWTSKNDVYRLWLKSYGRQGDFSEVELSTEFKTPPSIFFISDNRCVVWQQNARINKESGQRIGILTLE